MTEPSLTSYGVPASNPSFAGGLPVDGLWMSVHGANATLVRRDGPFTVTDERTGTFRTVHAVRTGLDGVEFPIERGWGVVEAEVGGSRVVVANTHTEAYDAATRDLQRDELVALLGDPGCPVVILGDFNATPDQVGMPLSYADAWTAAGPPPGS